MLLKGQEVAENCAGRAREDVTTWSRESMLRRQRQVGPWSRPGSLSHGASGRAPVTSSASASASGVAQCGQVMPALPSAPLLD